MHPLRKRLPILTACLLMALANGACLPLDALAQDSASTGPAKHLSPLSDDFVDEFDDAIPSDIPAYALDVALDRNAKTLGGSLEVVFINHTGKPQSEVPFRLYPNAEYYGEGSTSITGLVVDGEAAQPIFSVGNTVLTVPLGRLLPAGETTTIQMAFETVVPTDSPGSFGIFSHDAERDTWVLADWHPIVAGWQPGAEWELDPPTRWGDPTFAETSTYDVRISVPPSMSVVSTGTTNKVTNGPDSDTVEIETGPVREFAMVLDNGFEVSEIDAGGTAVRLHVDDSSPSTGAESVLAAAADTLNAFAARYGAYPYEELDLVQTELSFALGVSWSGLLFLDAVGTHAALQQAELQASNLSFTLVHEIGHQWWGGLIGVNSNDHAFMNESLTNYATIVAFEDISGSAAAQAFLEGSVAAPYLRQLEEHGDGIVDLPIEQASSITAYSRLVYGKGGLGFLAIRLEIGDAAFFDALRSYAQNYAFGLAAPVDLQSAFEQASGQSLDGLWQFWFKSATTTEQDVYNLLERAMQL